MDFDSSFTFVGCEFWPSCHPFRRSAAKEKSAPTQMGGYAHALLSGNFLLASFFLTLDPFQGFPFGQHLRAKLSWSAHKLSVFQGLSDADLYIRI